MSIMILCARKTQIHKICYFTNINLSTLLVNHSIFDSNAEDKLVAENSVVGRLAVGMLGMVDVLDILGYEGGSLAVLDLVAGRLTRRNGIGGDCCHENRDDDCEMSV